MELQQLVARLRRCGSITQRLVFVTFYAMLRVNDQAILNGYHVARLGDRSQRERVFEDEDDQGDEIDFIALDSILDVCLFLIRAPRFVFAVGGDGRVIRSADRGRTWRRLIGLAAELPSTQDPELDDILALLPDNPAIAPPESKSDSEMDDVPLPPEKLKEKVVVGIEIATKALRKAEERERERNKKGHTHVELHGIDCWGDSVVVCGANGTVAVSHDRGVRFSSLPSELLVAASSAAKNRTRSANEFATIRTVVFVSANTFTFVIGSTLLSAQFTILSDQVVWGVVRTLRVFPHPIGMVRLINEAVVVSTSCALHFSCDQGLTFITILHTFGTIRALVSLQTLTREQVPKIPESALVFSQTDTACQTTNTAVKKPFNFTTSSTLSSDSLHLEIDVFDSWVHKLLGISQSEREYGAYAMLVSGGNFIPYDFSATFFIWRELNDKNTFYTTAQGVQYIPFGQSSLTDKVGLGIAPFPKVCGGVGYRWVRSTIAGISTSDDCGQSWTDPVHAFTGSLSALDSGSFVICTSKKSVIVSNEGGNEFHLVAMPPALRVTTINDAAVMW